MKYVSDKKTLLDIPKGGTFADMVAIRGDKAIGEVSARAAQRAPALSRRVGLLSQRQLRMSAPAYSGKQMLEQGSRSSPREATVWTIKATVVTDSR